MKVCVVVKRPVENVNCPACTKTERGVLFRVDLSRLEEGLGHEGFECDRCRYRVKYVPPIGRGSGPPSSPATTLARDAMG